MSTITNAMNNSLNVQNRISTQLGLPNRLGDVIGTMVDLQTGNIGGALRNLVELNSSMTGSLLDRFTGGSSPAFSRGFVPRCECHGPHLGQSANTYPSREQVGKRAHIGQSYGFNWGPFELQGRITGEQYRGSFGKPIALANGDLLYRGRTYDNMNSIWRDGRDGRMDGQATTYRTRPGSLSPNFGNFAQAFPAFPGSLIGSGNGAGAGIGAGGQSIGELLNKIFGDITGKSANGAGGASGSGSASGANDSGELSQILSDPNMSLEDKLGVLMAKLSEHLDKQIEGKMQEISKAMQSEKGGQGAGGSNGSSPLGGLGSVAGGALGTAFGGPVGGMLGSSLGSMLGGSGGGAGGAGGAGGDGQKPNLQLLQTQLQQLVEKRTQMFQTMTSILKSLHETSLSTIRNLKA